MYEKSAEISEINRIMATWGAPPGPTGARVLIERLKTAEKMLSTMNRLLLTATGQGTMDGLKKLLAQYEDLRAHDEMVSRELAELREAPSPTEKTELVRLRKESARIDELLEEHLLQPGYAGVERMVRKVIVDSREIRRLREDAVGLRRALTIEGRKPCASCESTSELADLLGHDSIGHRAQNILGCAGLVTLAEIRERDDDFLSALRNMGPKILERIHERMDHCESSEEQPHPSE